MKVFMQAATKAAWIIAIVCLAAPDAALASSQAPDLAAIDASLQKCIDKEPSNVGMKSCTNNAYEAADKLLNKVYATITADLKKPGVDTTDADANKEKLKRLVASERAWIAFKNANCELQGIEMLGGTGEGLSIGSCFMTMTMERVKALRELFSER